MKNYIPKYLVQKNNIVWLVVGTAVFAELFITIFQPFGSRQWLENGLIYFAFATIVVLVAMGIIAISRTIMYKFGKTHRISYIAYATWILAEVIAMSMTYTVVVMSVYALFPDIAQTPERLDFLTLLGYAVLYTTFILFIPYTVCILVFALNDKNRQLLENQKLWEQAEVENSSKIEIFNFTDEKNDFALSVRRENLYYIMAADNYVDIVYQNSGKIKHFLLRQSLKNIEEAFAARGLVRCHRSYVVNVHKIKVLRKDDDGLTVDFDNDQLQPISVSKTYSTVVTEIFTTM